MFEEFQGIPAHPLLLHAAVVFVPLLALATIAYAFVPFVRPHTRVVLGLLAAGRWLLRRGSATLPRWAPMLPAYAIGCVSAAWLLERVAAMF